MYGFAVVTDHASVSWAAKVGGNARVRDRGFVSGGARVRDRAGVRDDATVFDDARVLGWAMICGRARVGGDAVASEHAQVGGFVSLRFGVQVRGRARVGGEGLPFNDGACTDAPSGDTVDFDEVISGDPVLTAGGEPDYPPGSPMWVYPPVYEFTGESMFIRPCCGGLSDSGGERPA